MNTDTPVFVTKAMRGMQITVGALVAGLLIFLATVVTIQALGIMNLALKDMKWMTWAALTSVGVMAAAQFVILPMMDRAGRQRIDAKSEQLQPWLQLFAARAIMGCAMLEGAGFYCLIVGMLTGEPINLIAAGVVAGLMLALHFPTVERFERFVERNRNAMLG